ncbi:low molecular weight protein-tyrosine-phosphatase [Rhabdobacter roseus]|uniref:protein-tyrosine-phosphatase n=1 Tax=Rhabdobacter roseus TaxID=1655419 RepID=A0A840THF0_9BACT|nr:protein-tyrosine phosphatase [Rhabdobacter roseus]
MGNICRSPVAEGVFRSLIEARGLQNAIQCDSAGTASYHVGSPPDRRMCQVAAALGVPLTHQARKLSGDDFYNYQYIIAMDEANFEDIRQQSYRSSGFYYPEDQLFLFREFDSVPDAGLSVPDPYYEDISVFEEVFAIVHRCGENLLEFLVEKHGLK